MMEELCICKICKKVFSDVNGLSVHKLNQHPQLNMTEKEITQQFRNNNISITRIHKETNPVPTSSLNQTTFRKLTNAGTSINARRADAKLMKQGEGRTMMPFRGPDNRNKLGGASMHTTIKGAQNLDDDTADWQKWDPGSKEKDNTSGFSDSSTIITASVAERATSAFCNSPEPQNKQGVKSLNQVQQQQPRKGVPPMYRISDIIPKNGKRPAPPSAGSSQRNIAVKTAPSAGSSAVAGIMQNLGKMKSMNKSATTSNRPGPPKVISLPSRAAPPPVRKAAVTLPKQSQPPAQPVRANKSPQVSKNKGKILPRNAFNNALPKPGIGGGHKQSQPPRLHAEMEMDVDDEEEGEEEEVHDYQVSVPPELREESPRLRALQPPKKTATPSIAPGNKSQDGNANDTKSVVVGGKITASKSLSSNRFNPLESKNKPPTTTARNGNSVKSTATKVEKKPPVVAKKSAPKKSGLIEELFQKMKEYVPTMPGTGYEMPNLSAVGSYTKNGATVWICLVCEKKEEEQSSQDMICCDGCEDWYHWSCVGIHKQFPEDQPWYCKRCIFQHSKNPTRDFPKLFKSNIAKE